MHFLLRQFYYYIFPPKIDPEIDPILKEYFSFYHGLTRAQQHKFQKRLQLYLLFAEFQGESQFFVSKKMKIIISGAAIQITFGLKRFLPKYYRNFQVMKGRYKIPELTAFLLGHVDKKHKSITLSWPDTEHGFQVPDDAHNVALHEMSHVILFENTLRFYWEEFFDRRDWENWLSIAEPEFIQLQKENSPVLKNYARNNLLELFAVSIESFFEQPGRLQLHLPNLYWALSKLLKQDPVFKTNPPKDLSYS